MIIVVIVVFVLVMVVVVRVVRITLVFVAAMTFVVGVLYRTCWAAVGRHRNRGKIDRRQRLRGHGRCCLEASSNIHRFNIAGILCGSGRKNRKRQNRSVNCGQPPYCR